MSLGPGGGSGYGEIFANDGAHGLMLRKNVAGTFNTTSLYSYGALEFYAGGVLASQPLRLQIQNNGQILQPVAGTSSNTTPHSILQAGLPTTGTMTWLLGQSATDYNAGRIMFHYAGAGQGTSYVGLGLMGRPMLMVTGEGEVLCSSLKVNGVAITGSGGGSTLAGTGLTKTGDTLSVNAAQPQITQVGTLANLDVGNVYASSLSVGGYPLFNNEGVGYYWAERQIAKPTTANFSANYGLYTFKPALAANDPLLKGMYMVGCTFRAYDTNSTTFTDQTFTPGALFSATLQTPKTATSYESGQAVTFQALNVQWKDVTMIPTANTYKLQVCFMRPGTV